MPGCLGRPQAESIMMLGCQDGHLETSFLERTYPLLRIEIGGIEECGIFFAVSPFTSCESIDTKMQESSQLHLLPFQLLRSRYKTCRHVYLLFQSGSLWKLYVLHIIVVLLLGLSGCADSGKKGRR